MAKLSNVQYQALVALKSQLESSRKNPSKLPNGFTNPTSHQPYMMIEGFFNTKTINVLVRKGLVDTFLDKIDMVVQINSRGLEVL